LKYANLIIDAGNFVEQLVKFILFRNRYEKTEKAASERRSTHMDASHIRVRYQCTR
jgi:hypothetical protein